MPFIAIALIVAAALGGGVSVAANHALPGDALWGFKTAVNENVEGALAVNDKAKADWDISVASARLDEAQKLAAKGSLDAKAQAALTANFDAHASDVADRISKLQSEGQASEAADVAARFQATLAAHAGSLTQAQGGASAEAQASFAPLLTDVRGTLDAAANLSAQASATVAAQGNDADGKDQAASESTQASTTKREGPQGIKAETSVVGGQGGIQVDSETGSKIGI